MSISTEDMAVRVGEYFWGSNDMGHNYPICIIDEKLKSGILNGTTGLIETINFGRNDKGDIDLAITYAMNRTGGRSFSYEIETYECKNAELVSKILKLRGTKDRGCVSVVEDKDTKQIYLNYDRTYPNYLELSFRGNNDTHIMGMNLGYMKIEDLIRKFDNAIEACK